jgi:hypothetical protein
MKEDVFIFYRMMQRTLGFLGRISALWSIPIVAVLGVYVVLSDVYNIGMYFFLFDSIDLYYILLHAKFEAVSSISVLRNNSLLEKRPNVNRTPHKRPSEPCPYFHSESSSHWEKQYLLSDRYRYILAVPAM